MNSKQGYRGDISSTLSRITGNPMARVRKAPLQWAWLVSGIALAILVSGCQLADMARFSYANATATRHWANSLHSTSVPFTLIDNHIILPVRVNGSESLNFVLDSGAGATVIIDSHGSRALPLKQDGELPVSGVGTGPGFTAGVVADTSLSIGALSLDGLSVVYLPLASIPFFDDLDDVYFDGVIGAPFFSRFIIDIDFDQGLVTFTEPSAAVDRLANLDQNWREVPLQVDSGLPYITAQVATGTGEPFDAKLLVDTGYRGVLSLTPGSDDELVVPTEYFESVGQGLSGDVPSRVAMSESMTLAGYQLKNIPVAYAMAGGESDGDDNGILGNRLLQQFNLRFDYPHKRLFLAPNRHFAAAINADRSGLLVRPHAAGGIVKRIAPGSSGQSSPLRVGDVITSFDDQAVTYLTIGELKRALESDRDSVHLCWLSGAAERCADLPLASRFGSDPSRGT